MSTFSFTSFGSAISINNQTGTRVHLKFTNGKFEISTNADSKELKQVNELKQSIRLFLTTMVDKKKSYAQRMNEVSKMLNKHADCKSFRILNNRIKTDLAI